MVKAKGCTNDLWITHVLLILILHPSAYITRLHSLTGASPPDQDLISKRSTQLISWMSQRSCVKKNFLKTNILLMCTWLPLISHSLPPMLPVNITHSPPSQPVKDCYPANLSKTYWSPRTTIFSLLNVWFWTSSLPTYLLFHHPIHPMSKLLEKSGNDA